MAKPIMAIMYDFDNTLALTDMQNFSFIPSLGMTPDEFWGETGKFTEQNGVERILSYMYMMVKLSKEKGIKLTKEFLNQAGEKIEFYDGVTTWFKRINEYGEKKGITVEHYLLSSGTKEIVEGCKIAKEFKEIYGCEFYFDEKTQEPVWPKFAINYTQKTQYYYRISKGIYDSLEDKKLNEKQETKRIPYSNMVYIGDGLTDVPCMILVKENGGRSIAVYEDETKDKVELLHQDGRVNYTAPADYHYGSKLERIIKLMIDRISSEYEFEKKELSLSGE